MQSISAQTFFLSAAFCLKQRRVRNLSPVTPERKLEFTARYIPWQRESKEIVVRRVVPIRIAIKVGEKDNYHAGFWLYETGCNPVKLAVRVSGLRKAPATKRVIKFGCEE